MKDLTEKGVVEKVFMEAKCSYSIRDGFTKPLTDAVSRFNVQ